MEPITTEQPIVEITLGPLDREAYLRFGCFAMFRYPRSIVVYATYFALLPLVLLGLYISAFLQPYRDFTLAVCITAGYLTSLPVLLTSRRRAFRRMDRAQREAQPQPAIFTFYEDQLQIQGGTKLTQGTQQVQYAFYNKVYETKYAFYLSHGSSAQIMDKKYLTEDQAAALRALFARKFGDKFRRIK